MRRIRLLLLTSAAALAAAPSAHAAGVFPGDPIDGPTADILAVGEADLARDSTGGVVYVKRDGGVPHIFVARFAGGAFGPPERVDGPLGTPSGQPALAAGNNGRLAVVFQSGGALYGVVKPARDQPFSAPVLISPTGTTPSVDMSINGTAYTAFTDGTDVRIGRLDRRSNQWTLLPQGADVDPPREAGTGDLRPRVAVSADGVAVVTWGEAHSDGRTHVYARKVFGQNVSTRPQDLTLAAFEGRAAGNASQPDVDAQDDSSFAQVVFRQEVGGVSRVFARRQRGTEFDDPVAIDDAEGAQQPRIDLSGRGLGLAGMVSASSRQPVVGGLLNHKWGTGSGRSGVAGALVSPVIPAMAENSDGFVTWVQATSASPEVRVRQFDNHKPLDEPLASKPELGPVDASAGFDSAIDRANSGIITFVQGAGGDRKLVAAYIDRAPGGFAGLNSQTYRRSARPVLSWQTALDLFGPVTYRVILNNTPVGEVTTTKFTPGAALPEGVHRWRVIAFDRRGQQTSSRTRLLRIDTTKPRLSVSKRGSVVSARASDPRTPTASGIRHIRFTLPSGRTRTVKGQRASVRVGKGRVRVSAYDVAGNVTTRNR